MNTGMTYCQQYQCEAKQTIVGVYYFGDVDKAKKFSEFLMTFNNWFTQN